MEQEKIKTLVQSIKELNPKRASAKTAFLENSSVRKAIEEKIKEGTGVKIIHEAIVKNGYKISLHIFRNWVRENFKKSPILKN